MISLLVSMSCSFLSTLSLRRATNNINSSVHAADISIHALLAESDSASDSLSDTSEVISIHALLAESDSDPEASNRTERQISIHALLAESDSNSHPVTVHTWKFLSTLSLRRATLRNE